MNNTNRHTVIHGLNTNTSQDRKLESWDVVFAGGIKP
jgi:hypothetical protein